MIRILLITFFMLTSQFSYAGDVSDFFDSLQGKWVLKEGEIINIDARAQSTHLKITDLTSTVEKTSEKEWKFVEHYCVETDCIDTSYFYVLENDEDLYLVTEEGRSELIVVNSAPLQIQFLLRTENSYSLTDCVIVGKEMVQAGSTMNSDFTRSEVKIVLTKSESK